MTCGISRMARLVDTVTYGRAYVGVESLSTERPNKFWVRTAAGR